MTNGFTNHVLGIASQEASTVFRTNSQIVAPVTGSGDATQCFLEGNTAPATINTTNRLVLTAPIERVRASFAKHVAEAGRLHRERIRSANIRDNRIALDRILQRRIEALETMSESDFEQIASFIGTYSRLNSENDALRRIMMTLLLEKSATTHFEMINCWMKYVLCMMWTDRLVLLPLSFRMRGFLTADAQRMMLPKVLTCHLACPDPEGLAFGQALTLASRFYDFPLIDIDVFGLAVIDLLRQHQATPDGVRGLRKRQAWYLFVLALRSWSASGADEGFRPITAEIESFPYWLRQTRQGKTDLKPSDFFPIEAEHRKNHVRRGRKDYIKRRLAAQVDLIEHDDPEAAKEALWQNNKTLPEIHLEAIADRVNSPEDILIYMRLLRGKGAYRPEEGWYPARMDFFPASVWATWNDLFERYHDHRARRGMERISSWDSLNYVFRDYIGCYLPWWQQMHPGVDVVIPRDASEFSRFGHWVESQRDQAAPLPLLRLFDETRHGDGADGLNGFVSDIHGFFEFCRGDAARLGLRRLEFMNPVTPTLDRMVSRKLQRTNKDPIPKAVLPYLLRYAYAVERWYMDLAERSLAGTLSDGHRRQLSNYHRPDLGFEAAAFGIDAAFEFDGRNHAITTVPLVATWEERQVRDAGLGTRSVYLPALSGLRMCVTALETGLRFQGVQWLDRRTYRSRVGVEAEGAELLPLIVNTDKVKDHPWVTTVVRRVHEMLLREEAYQDLLAGSEVERLVPYEGRKHTRFASVSPLFRAPKSDFPVSDHGYATTWERLIVGFSLWYEREVSGEPLRMWWFEAEVDKLTGEPRVVMHVEGDEKPRRCCPLKVKLRHTPHSARSSFISARNGILPIEVTGSLVGQANTATTYHYVVESEEEVGAKVLAASNSIWQPDTQNPVHVRADQVNSALRRSFAAGRTETEAAFGFQTLSLLNEENQDVDGVLRLRSTPMGQVTFRETHVCPVGEMCPSDVLDIIVEPRRCGLCPLAVKAVDHLPSIGARMRMLLEQVQEGGRLIERMQRRGEPEATVDEVQQRRRLDVMEHEGWRTSLLALQRSLEELGQASSRERFQVGRPDAVRLHLKLVTRESGKADFLLQRICDSAGHTAFETPHLRAQARQLQQRLLTSARTLEGEISSHPDDPVGELLGSLRLALEARGIAPTFRAALEAVGMIEAPDASRASLALPPTGE